MEQQQCTKLPSGELRHRLNQFSGSERYFRHQCGVEILLTEGAKFLADQAGAYWLMDIIASAVPYFRENEFVSVHLTREAEGSGATVSIRSGAKVYHTQKIAYTDFPLQSIKLFAAITALDESRERYVVMLPGEY